MKKFKTPIILLTVLIVMLLQSCQDSPTGSEVVIESALPKITETSNVSVFRTNKETIKPFYQGFDEKFNYLKSFNFTSDWNRPSEFYPNGYWFYHTTLCDAEVDTNTGEAQSLVDFGITNFNDFEMVSQSYFKWKGIYGFETDIDFDNFQTLKIQNSDSVENSITKFKLNKPVKLLNDYFLLDSTIINGITLNYEKSLSNYFVRIIIFSYDIGNGEVEIIQGGNGFEQTPNITQSSNSLTIIAEKQNVNSIHISAEDVNYLLENGKNKLLMICGLAVETSDKTIDLTLKSNKNKVSLPIYHFVNFGGCYKL